jgi:uncharacterized protein (DUF4415 family)
MANEVNIKRFSAAELSALRAQGKSETDLARVRAKTEAELERDIADDPDARDLPQDWFVKAQAVMPEAKSLLSLRLDDRVVAWFKQGGPGYQTRINAVLRAFVEHEMQRRSKSGCVSAAQPR